jgi:hypothetical protein
LTDTRRKLDVVAACADRKKLQPRDDLRLGSIAGDPAERLARWRDAVEHSDGARVPASKLYQGQHWRRIAEAVDFTRSHGWETRLWVLSAGLGLVAGDSKIVSYSATFANGRRDSVWRGSADGPRAGTLRWWWQELADDGLARLAASSQGPVVIVAGRTYVDAIAADLEEISSNRSSSSRTVVLSTGLDHPLGLRYDHRVRAQVGGTLGSLNASLLRALARRPGPHGWNRNRMQDVVDRLMSMGAAPVSPSRRPCSDAQVRDFLVAVMGSTPGISRSRALRAFRDAGMACSQERLARIFESLG